MRIRLLTLLAGLLFDPVAVLSVRLPTVTDAVTATARWALQSGDLPLQVAPDGQERFLIGIGLIAFSLVIFAVWGIWKFGGGSDTDAADSEGDATADSEETDEAILSNEGSRSAPSRDTERPSASPTDTGTGGETTGFERASGNTFSWSEVEDDSTVPSSDGTDSAGSPAQSNVTASVDDDSAPVDLDEHTLDDARAALADGAYETAVEDAYTTACEVLQTQHGVESAESPEMFYDRCASNSAIDDSITHHLEALTDVHDRAVYGYGAATEDEAEQALSHATAILMGGATNS